MGKNTEIRIFFLPLLSFRGFFVLLGGASIPFLGFLVDLSVLVIAALLACYSLSFLLLLALSGVHLKKIIKEATFDLEIPETMFSGVDATVKVLLTTKSKSSFDLKVLPHIPENFIFKSNKELSLKYLPNSSSYITKLSNENTSPVEQNFELSFEVKPLARGKYYFEGFSARVSNRFDLCKFQFVATLKFSKEVEVFPNDQITSQHLQSFYKLQQGSKLIDSRLGSGREFDSLRQYSLGDDLRKVDWKRSARGKNLLVKIYRPETHQRVNIAIDCGRRMSVLVGERRQIEYVTDAASQLLMLAQKSEDELGLFAFSHKIQKSIKSRKGLRQERLIRQALLELEVDELEPDYQLLTRWAGMNRNRSLMILITSLANPSGLSVIGSAMKAISKRHIPLVFAVSDSDIQELVYSPANNLAQAYSVAAAVEQTQRIRKEAEKLTMAGIDCVYCQAKELPDLLEQKYVKMKLSGRL